MDSEQKSTTYPIAQVILELYNHIDKKKPVCIKGGSFQTDLAYEKTLFNVCYIVNVTQYMSCILIVHINCSYDGAFLRFCLLSSNVYATIYTLLILAILFKPHPAAV